MALFEEVVTLFDSLPREIEADVQQSGGDPYARVDAFGKTVSAWDFILRTMLLQSAGMQFLYAIGHLLRGHSLEIFAHARTIIESAGIAYLSKSEPDLGDLYFNAEDTTYRRRTVRSKILPDDDPLTVDLTGSFDHASEIFHANFISIASRIDTEFVVEVGKRDFRNDMKFHDVNSEEPEPYLRNAAWLLRVGARVLRLFASAFGLPDCVWYRRLEAFEDKREECFRELYPLVKSSKTTI